MQREEHDTWAIVVEEAKAGDEYQYVLHCGDQKLRRTDPRARKVVNSVGPGIVWTPPPSPDEPRFVAPSMDQLIVYEMHIGSFHASAGRDGTAKRPGTFASAIEKLPYLRDLGVNAVEIMPVCEFAGDFSWGYNPAHPFAVESAYGGPEGLLKFVRAAHDHGLAVIIDAVYNHFGPSDLPLWQFDGWNENNLGGIYFYNDWRAATPWGDTRPDYGRGEVRTYIHDNALMWMRDFGVDGLRWDMTVFIRSYKGNPGSADDDLKEGWGLMQWLNESIHREFPHAITIAEDLRDSEWLVKGTGVGGAGFNSQWDSAFVHPVRGTLTPAEDSHRHLDAIIGALQNRYDGDASSASCIVNRTTKWPMGRRACPARSMLGNRIRTQRASVPASAPAWPSPRRACRCCSRARNSSRTSGSVMPCRSTGRNSSGSAASIASIAILSRCDAISRDTLRAFPGSTSKRITSTTSARSSRFVAGVKEAPATTSLSWSICRTNRATTSPSVSPRPAAGRCASTATAAPTAKISPIIRRGPSTPRLTPATGYSIAS
jgi:hypothetical protein